MVEVQEKLLKIMSDVPWRKTPEHTYSEQEWEVLLSTAEDQGILFLVLQGCTSIRQQLSSASWLKWRSKLISTIWNVFEIRPKRDVKAMSEEILRAGSTHNKNNTEESSSFFVDERGTKSSTRVFISKINSLARRKFPITKKLPFLLPLFWIYIPLRYWLRSLMGKRRRKLLLRTMAITKQRKRLYRRMNLFRSVQDK